VEVSAISVADSTKLSKSLVTLIPAIRISLTPFSVDLQQRQSQQFSAAVSGTTNQAVSWSLSPAIGTLSTSGLYTAPATVLTAQTVTVTARNVVDPTKSASGVVYLQAAVGDQWSMGYYWPSAMPVSAIQWTGLTHIIECNAVVNADGTLDLTSMGFLTKAASLVTAAHNNNVKALVGLVQYTPTNFDRGVTSHLSAFVNNIMTVVDTYGFDGVDIDWEPFVPSTSGSSMAALAAALRTSLGNKTLTVAVPSQTVGEPYWGNHYISFDRINVMTYDMSGVDWSYGWFNAPIYGHKIESLDAFRTAFLAAGVPAAKLSLGLPFYGCRWTGGVVAADPTQGVSGPLQVWQSGDAPTASQINYNTILPLINQQNYHWDNVALVPYINYLGATRPAYWYLTYDDPQSIQAKVQYIIANDLGGWIIWALDQDYLPGAPRPHPLLDAVQAGSAPAVLNASALRSGTVGALYSALLGATGAGPLQWSLSGGSLPNGLSLSSPGVISGTPITAGTFSFRVTVRNFAGSFSQSFTITIVASA